ncbi:MAG: hypothetical protein KGQ28_11180, partial [Hyphomicrobiales bacterium]|nr:hypothetical protein [Hyphomicrobiales bacterium]
LLTGAEGLLERLAALNDATPALGMGRANALAMVAQTLARAGSKKAPETAKVALTLASKAVVEAPSDPDARHARGFAEEVEAEVDPGLSDDARLAFADRAAEDYRACASSSAPIGPQCLADEVNALGWKGNYLAGRGRFQEASVVYGAAAEVAREGTAGTADPKVKATMEREAAEIGLQNAVALQKLGRLDDALKSYGEAIAYFEGQGSAQVDNDVRIALGNAYNGAAATMLAKAGGQRLDRATATPILALLFKARDMILPIVRNDPGNLYWARNLVIVDSNVAAIDERIGDVADARRFDAEAAAISRNIKAAGG